jgi:hypothetical protein
MAAQQRGARQFSPRSISAGDLIHFLQAQQAEGKSYAFIKEAAGSVSMAVFEGSDGAIHLGKQTSMVKFLKSVRLKQPVGPRKASVPEYFDVALLFGEAWKFGPNKSLCLGHLKEKLLVLLLVDTAARPSDVARIYRIMSGRHAQIVFEGRDMRLRYFWPKEVDPGSSRKNATNIYFSTWVKVCGSTPDSIDTVACMREFLARSSDATLYANTYIAQLAGEFQPLIYARLKDGKLQKSSVDHISNVVQAAMDRCQMGAMKTAHLRGASTSKIVQLVPMALPRALEMGRWTSETMFRQHYCAPVMGSWDPVPAKYHSNCQQVLRWGFQPDPPPGISTKEYYHDPSVWVGKSLQGNEKVLGFSDGTYESSTGNSYCHWDLMEAISSSRK